MMFEPLADRVVVSRITAKDKTEGGLYIPEASKEKPAEGKVLGVGPGRRNQDGSISPIGFGVGVHVFFARFAGTEIEIDGEKLTVLREEDILGVKR